MPLSCIVLALAVLAVGGWSYDKGDTIMLDDDTMYEDLFSPDLIRQDIMASNFPDKDTTAPVRRFRPANRRSRIDQHPYHLKHHHEMGLVGEAAGLASKPQEPGSTKLEVVRFITPYGRNMSKYIDITPLANSLHGSVLGVFIDTWSPAPAKHLLIEGPNKTCHVANKTFGDGWMVSASLILNNVSCLRPALHVLPLTSGMEAFKIGVTVGISAELDTHHQVTSPERAKLEVGQFDVMEVCNMTQQNLAKRLAWEYAIDQFTEDRNSTVSDMMNNGLFDSQMAPAAHGTVAAHTATELELHDLSQPAAPGAIILARPFIRSARNPKFPSPELRELGTVTSITQQAAGSAKLKVAWKSPSMCLNGSQWAVQLVQPAKLAAVRSFLTAAKSVAATLHTKEVREMSVVQVTATAAGVPPPYACVPLLPKQWQIPNDTAIPLVKPGNVTVVGYNYTGTVLKRKFSLDVAPGEQALLELVSTGHGQYGALQCGEFCDIQLTVKLDGSLLGRFVQVPPNCSQNPVTDQLGQWQGPRAQWCPGSIVRNPTKSFDITSLVQPVLPLDKFPWTVKQTKHEVTVDIAVREMFGNGTFKKYNDPMGFTFGANQVWEEAAAANLNLAMSVQIYSKLHPKNKSSGVHPCPKPDPWYEVPSELPKPGHESSSAAVIEMIQKVTADKAQRILLSERFDAKDAHTVAAWAAAGKQVGLLLELAAPPNGQADRWDRLGSVSLERTPGWANRRHQFPTGPLLIGYANWGQCNEQIMQAVNSGVNVLVWFSLNLVVDSATGLPTVAGPASSAGFLGCVAKMATEIKRAKKQVTHLVSIGGWNSPHPDPRFGVQVWWDALRRWNELSGVEGWSGFDGFDWDVEGNDSPSSPSNHFTTETLDLMGGISQAAKNAGYLWTITPAQSYLDPTTSQFSRQVDLAPPWKKGFNYAGRNTYAYLLAKYGIATFDLVTVQLYEGWSAAKHSIDDKGQAASEYLASLIEQMQRGWEVNFSTDPDPRVAALGTKVIRIPKEKLLMGLANSWAADAEKFLLIMPEDCGKAYSTLADSTKPRGWMFWNIQDEGKEAKTVQVIDGKRTNVSQPMWMAQGLAKFLFADPQV